MFAQRVLLASAVAFLPILIPCVSGARAQAVEPPPVVAAASDLQFALTEIAAAFRSETGLEIKISFGSSGNFARQMRQQAPFQIFFSADEKYVTDLARDGISRDVGHVYAVGRLALFVPNGSSLKADGSLSDLAQALRDGRIAKFAIANPEHAPYGRRAQEALQRAGIWDAIKDKLVLGENISQAAQFATSGSTAGGLIAHSLAMSPRVAGLGRFALIPEDMHEPLRQRMVLLRNAGQTAERFYQFVLSGPGRSILDRSGFTIAQ